VKGETENVECPNQDTKGTSGFFNSHLGIGRASVVESAVLAR
jgi:hypothetical protein